VEYLNAHKDPEITYEVELADLYGSRGAQEEAIRFGLGDTVRVVDPVLGLDVSTRVMEREADILHPGRVRVKLDNPVRGLADVLAALRNAQEEALKRTRSAFAESSTAAETGSTRLGFSNQSFRFFASITVTGWNSLSWSAGTLRIGDAWFSINSNTVSSLAGSSTYFFYFDRGSPTTFGYTTTHTQAEGEDRILVFAVTTTSSPEPCVIHPMGIIHG
jgi:hypothetical protein